MRATTYLLSAVFIAVTAACANISTTTTGTPTPDPSGTPTPVPGSPEVTSRRPVPGNPDAWVRTPIEATFTEPLDEATLDGNVRLVDENGSELATTLSLEDGGTRLVVTPDAIPPAPNQLTVELTANITDLEGESLVVPADEWTWTLNVWQTLAFDKSEGVSVGQARVALAPDLTPVLVWDEDDDNVVPGGSLYAHRFVDGAWEPLGNLTALSVDMTGPRAATAPDGRVAVIVSQSTNTGTHPFVYEFDGTAWVQLGNALTFGGQEFSFNKAIAYLNGEPVIAWSEGSEAQVHVAGWTGSSWSLLGGTYISDDTGGSSALVPEISVEKQGQMLVTWQDDNAVHVREWDGASWNPVGGGALPLPAGTSSAFAPAIARAADGTPVVAFQAYETNAQQSNGYVYELDAASWSPLGGPLNVVNTPSVHTYRPYVGANVAGNLFAAFEEDGTTYVAEYANSVWTPSAELNPNADVASGVSVVFYSFGTPVVTMTRDDGTGRTIYVYRHNS